MQLYFIRHGETEMNVKGILTGTLETDITNKGRKEANDLSKQLNINFDAYYCSPLKRTIQTLYEIKGDVNYIVDKRITEIFSGDWQGKRKDELPIKEYSLYKQGKFTPPNGENLKEVDKRILSFLKDMSQLYHKDEKILVVTHNGFIRQLKRLFSNDNTDNSPKNLEIFIVTDKMIKDLEGQNG